MAIEERDFRAASWDAGYADAYRGLQLDYRGKWNDVEYLAGYADAVKDRRKQQVFIEQVWGPAC